MLKYDNVHQVSINDIKPYPRNAKIHGEDQIRKIADSITEFGFLNPILLDTGGVILAGHGRLEAAKLLGMAKVPCLYADGLTEAQKRAYILADNRLTELGGWDEDLLDEELRALFDEGFDIELTGFDLDLDGIDAEKDTAEKINPTQTLPESRVLVCSISAFGTNSEIFIEVPLSQDDADHLLKRTQEINPGDISAKLTEAFRAL